MQVLVTGSSGLIGSEAVRYFHELGHEVTGVDNDLRADFFGPRGSTIWNRDRLLADFPGFRHVDLDIRDRAGVLRLFRDEPFDLVIHAAAQPSHDLAAERPFDDFEVNALATLNLLEACRQHRPDTVFIFMSTNKVYGDGPNQLALEELPTRYDFADAQYRSGIAEDFPVDRCLHSLFGVSKLSADVMVQEYGRYFGLPTGVFRGGCLTGPSHSGVSLHGFLSYLVQVAVEQGEYTVIGYGGKQVRDQIHARDVIDAFWHFARAPRPGEVYNLGGGRENAASVLEVLELVEEIAGTRPQLSWSEEPRRGDHICYYSDLRKLRAHYPRWAMKHSLRDIVEEMVEAARRRSGVAERS